jgi:ammonia channel protein AmtB
MKDIFTNISLLQSNKKTSSMLPTVLPSRAHGNHGITIGFIWIGLLFNFEHRGWSYLGLSEISIQPQALYIFAVYLCCTSLLYRIGLSFLPSLRQSASHL